MQNGDGIVLALLISLTILVLILGSMAIIGTCRKRMRHPFHGRRKHDNMPGPGRNNHDGSHFPWKPNDEDQDLSDDDSETEQKSEKNNKNTNKIKPVSSSPEQRMNSKESGRKDRPNRPPFNRIPDYPDIIDNIRP